MPKITAADLRDMAQPYLPEGETVRHAAFGVRQPPLALIVVLVALAVLPGVLAIFFMTRNYVVALGDRTLVILQVRPAYLKMRTDPRAVKSTRLVPLATLKGQGGATKTGGLFTHVSFGTGDDGFRAKFHRAFSKDNRAEAIAIGEAVVAAS